ncbi:hypothetical protein PENANT_c058G00064 [Penicillium antarcticum]|uniref:Uncharacterized protein n=1 Tax=Penicillium antarcticum TaxID=416450 RepID=A0A1V6PQB0_9EURO|nr:hypothetical protein PENANT_c058G00064 [Penicillium antarcticum]
MNRGATPARRPCWLRTADTQRTRWHQNPAGTVLPATPTDNEPRRYACEKTLLAPYCRHATNTLASYCHPQLTMNRAAMPTIDTGRSGATRYRKLWIALALSCHYAYWNARQSAGLTDDPGPVEAIF